MTELHYTKKYPTTNLVIISVLLVALACIVVYFTTTSGSLLISIFIGITLAIFVGAGYIDIVELTIQVRDNTITILRHKSKKEIIIPFSEITSFQAIEIIEPAEINNNTLVKEMTIRWRNKEFTMKEEIVVTTEKELLLKYTNFTSMLYNLLNDYKEKNALTFHIQFKQGYVESEISGKEESIESLKERDRKNIYMGSTWFFVTISIVMLFALFMFVDTLFFTSNKSFTIGDFAHLSIGFGVWITSFAAWSFRQKLKKRLKDSTSEKNKSNP